MRRRLGAALAGITLLLSACTGGSDDSTSSGGGDFSNVGNCTPVTAAVSSEKVGLFAKLSEMFQKSPEAKGLAKCAAIVPVDVASGVAADLLKRTEPWPLNATDKAQPVIWSPASSTWVAQVAERKGKALVPDPKSFARSPVAWAMPEAMAKTLGWPNKPIGLKDLRDLCLDPRGWGKFGTGNALWGGFKVGKTNPTSSTTGLNILGMQAYAAVGKRDKLTTADVARSAAFSRDIESCVMHYGDTTGSILQRAYDRDQQGKPMGYVSAVAVEETSIVNYNQGNPKSNYVKPGTQLTKPKQRMVAIYPSEGSLVSDNPLVVVGAPWVKPEQRTAAQAFAKFVQTQPAQDILDDFGFRPVDPKAKVGGLLTVDNGVDPSKPTVLLEQPSGEVAAALVGQWNLTRRPSSVIAVLDVSESMGREAFGGKSRMQVAQESTEPLLAHFRPTDEFGFWTFSTDIVPNTSVPNVVELRPVQPMGGARERLLDEVEKLTPVSGTPLYDTIAAAHKHMQKRAQPGRINAVIVLSDGDDTASEITLDQLLSQLRGPAERNDPAQVRVFPIIFTGDAPSDALRDIAEASGGQVFDASDPRRLEAQIRAVANNF